MTIIAYGGRATGIYPLSPDGGEPRFGEGAPDITFMEEGEDPPADPVYGTEPPPHDPATQTIRAGDVVEVDGLWQQIWIIEDRPALSEDELRARLAARRLEVETGGTLWRGVPVSTSEGTQARLAEAVAAFEGGQPGPGGEVTFIRDDGAPMVIDREAMLAIHATVTAHVAASDAAAEAIGRAIEAGTVTTLAALDYHSAWPLNP